MADDPGGTNMARDEAKMGTREGIQSSIFGPPMNEMNDNEGTIESQFGSYENNGGKGKGKENAQVGTPENANNTEGNLESQVGPLITKMNDNEGNVELQVDPLMNKMNDTEGDEEPQVGPSKNEGGKGKGKEKAKVGTPENADDNEGELEDQVITINSDVEGDEETKAGPSKKKGGKNKGKEKAKVGPPEDLFKHHDVPKLEPIDKALADIDHGPELKPLPDLVMKMMWQFDRTLGYPEFVAFCNEITTKYRSGEKDSRQAFARTFTSTRKKPTTVLEMELARCSHGGYLPKFALKYATKKDCPPMAKWADSSKEAYDVLEGRPQPKGQSGPQKMTFTPATGGSPSAKVGSEEKKTPARKPSNRVTKPAGRAPANRSKIGSSAAQKADKKGANVGSTKRKRIVESDDDEGDEEDNDEEDPELQEIYKSAAAEQTRAMKRLRRERKGVEDEV